MSAWDDYPPDYRAAEVRAITTAVRAGECVSVVGLSGAGKSNLLAFLAHRSGDLFTLVDCNRLPEPTSAAFFRHIRSTLTPADSTFTDGDSKDDWSALEAAIHRRLNRSGDSLSLLFDRFDVLVQAGEPELFNRLRALRDGHKYAFTFVTATRRPIPPDTEIAELFFANTLWLGPLSESDALWNVTQYAKRKGQEWDAVVARALIAASGGYPSLLRAVCEAFGTGSEADVASLSAHPAVRARLEEFWAANPSDEELRLSGLQGLPLLKAGGRIDFNAAHLTAHENRLLNYFLAHPDTVCEKDDLIRSVWLEDKVFERGVRDDSLAQLIRRLREKVEPDSANPRYIRTVPGRGYRFTRG